MAVKLGRLCGWGYTDQPASVQSDVEAIVSWAQVFPAFGSIDGLDGPFNHIPYRAARGSSQSSLPHWCLTKIAFGRHAAMVVNMDGAMWGGM